MSRITCYTATLQIWKASSPSPEYDEHSHHCYFYQYHYFKTCNQCSHLPLSFSPAMHELILPADERAAAAPAALHDWQHAAMLQLHADCLFRQYAPSHLQRYGQACSETPPAVDLTVSPALCGEGGWGGGRQSEAPSCSPELTGRCLTTFQSL